MAAEPGKLGGRGPAVGQGNWSLVVGAAWYWGIAGLIFGTISFLLPPVRELLSLYFLLAMATAAPIGPMSFYLLRRYGLFAPALLQRQVVVQERPKTEEAEPRKRAPKRKKEEKSPEAEGVEAGVLVSQLPARHRVLDQYWIEEPFAKILIAQDEDDAGAGPRYFVEEVRLSPREHQAYRRISEILSQELSPREIGKEQDIKNAILQGARQVWTKYKKAFHALDDASWKRIQYYLERDMLGFGAINAIMKDFQIEDLSCDGVGSSVFVWHRRFESIPTNIHFTDRTILDDFIIKLAHKAGKHVSSAFPIVDAMLYGRHRLAASFRDEISPKGSTFTIRKFREEPLSIVDLIQLGTISEELAGYFWVLLENRATVMIIGGTGSGKTSLLNALATLVRSGMKIVTVEETAELNLPHENWVQLTSRESFGLTGTKAGQISLFDLVRMSLRYRPDYLVVGEVRGEEAFVLFQALATGHGGLSTMHADNLDYAVKRLTSSPMNIAETYVPLMNAVVQIERVPLAGEQEASFGRRVRNVWEVVDYGKYINVAEWQPAQDRQTSRVDRSLLLGKLATKTGKTRSYLMEELERRRRVIHWMVEKAIHRVRDVSQVVSQYYGQPEAVLRSIEEHARPPVPTAGGEIEAAPLPPSVPHEVRTTLEKLAPAGGDELKIIKQMLEPIIGEGGSVKMEDALQGSGLDAVTFWNHLHLLKTAGLLVAGELPGRDGTETYVVATELARAVVTALKSEPSL